jgi:hypothetical protein
LTPFEDKVQRRLKSNALVVVRRHVVVVGVATILPIDDLCHSLKGLDHTLLRDDAILEPIGDMLARYPERRPIFHQRNVVDVRNL